MHFMLSLLGPTSNRAYPGRSKVAWHVRNPPSEWLFRWKNWLFNRGPFCTLEVTHGIWKSDPGKGDSYWTPSFQVSWTLGGVMVYSNHQRTGLQLKLGSVFYWWCALRIVRWWITIKPPFGRICLWLVSGILCKSRGSSCFGFTNLNDWLANLTSTNKIPNKTRR